ncbi:MAG: c-type cytochrome biogenesis protein CcsB [Desulfobacterales bacterium]|nr:c-type cytochrome biogenesis protein CcsB [Desulfobacterales bacterium]
MEILTTITTVLYLLSTAGYIKYLIFQKNYLFKAGYGLLLAGFFFHSAAIGFGYFVSGHIPVSNLYETLVLATWAIVGVFVAFQFRFQIRILGIYTAPLAALVMIAASQLPKTAMSGQVFLKNLWLLFHIVAIFVGEASLALACGAGLLYLLQEHAIKTKNHGFFFRRLPSLDLIDTTGYACLVLGFTMLTFGLVTGIIYAKSFFGRFWGWDPKEVWSAITWLLYAALLHGRITMGWRGRRAATMSIIGFGVLLFTFLGVNFLLKGHHGQFTGW